MNTPILLIIYNRPDKVRALITALKKIKPENIYVYCDGAKDDRDKIGVLKSRKIIDQITWTKNVHTKFMEENRGCKIGVISAIDWLFENEDEGIILEDDCIPNKSFFKFTTNLLEKYRFDSRVGLISGHNFGYSIKPYQYDYYFSIFSCSWGWATWASRWNDFRSSPTLIDTLKDGELIKSIKSLGVSNDFLLNVEKSSSGKLDTWDYLWSYFNIINNRLTIYPQNNLVSNIGFGNGSTHTSLLGDFIAQTTKPLEKDIMNPPFVQSSVSANRSFSKRHVKFILLLRLIRFSIQRIVRW